MKASVVERPVHSGLKGGHTNRFETFHSNFFVGVQAKSTSFETTSKEKNPCHLSYNYKGFYAIAKLKNREKRIS